MLQKTVIRFKPGMGSHIGRRIGRTGMTWAKRDPNAWRRVFSITSGGDLNLMVVFAGFDTFENMLENDSTWEEDYNEEFGWEQNAIDNENFNKSLREWNGAIRTTLERVDF